MFRLSYISQIKKDGGGKSFIPPEWDISEGNLCPPSDMLIQLNLVDVE